MASGNDKRIKDIYAEAEKRMAELRARRQDAIRRLRETADRKRIEKARGELSDV